MRCARTLLRDERGSTLVETTLVFPLMLILTFGLVELGHLFWQWNTAEKATAMGARYIATRGPLLPGVPDCFVETSQIAGTSCSQVAGSTGWGATCSGAGGGPCDGAVLSAVIAEVQRIAPFVEPGNVEVELNGSAMGFVGRGAPVPLVTVRLVNMSFDFVAMDSLVGVGPITMPGFDATLVAEDQQEGVLGPG